jgi:hypothetical protein
MDDDEWNVPALGSQESGDVEVTESQGASPAPSPAKPAKCKRAGKAAGAAGATVSARAKGVKKKAPRGGKNCFALACPHNKVKGSKWCKEDTAAIKTMRYQAVQDSVYSTFERLMSDPTFAAKALADFKRENPPHQFRKKLIDWRIWKKTFGITLEKVEHEGESLFDVNDYIFREANRSGLDLRSLFSYKLYIYTVYTFSLYIYKYI